MVELVHLVRGHAQSLVKLVLDELCIRRPLLETLGNQGVRKTVELAVAGLHLVVLRIEDDRLLDLLHVDRVEHVLTDRKLLDTEVRFEAVADRISALDADAAVEELQLRHRWMLADQFRDRKSSHVTDLAVSEIQLAKELILLETVAQNLCLLAVHLTVGQVQSLDERVGVEDWLEH